MNILELIVKGCSSSSTSLQCCGIDAVVLLAVHPFNVVKLDAAVAAHPHNVELESKGAAM